MDIAIQKHNQRPAAVWSPRGQDYDQISRGISDSIDHCVLRLEPKPGERILDLATGTGWTSRVVARRGARVTDVDIASELVAAARLAGLFYRLRSDQGPGRTPRRRQARAAAARLYRLPRQFRDGTGHLRAARILGDGGCEKVIFKGDEP